MNASSQNPANLASRRYKIDFTVSMVAYVVVLFGSIWALGRLPSSGAFHYVVAMLPVVPVVFVFIAVVRYLRSTDEFTRAVQLESLAIAAGITAMLSVTYGFLELVGFPHLSAWITYLVVMGSWAIAKIFVARRYGSGYGCD